MKKFHGVYLARHCMQVSAGDVAVLVGSWRQLLINRDLYIDQQTQRVGFIFGCNFSSSPSSGFPQISLYDRKAFCLKKTRYASPYPPAACGPQTLTHCH